jgi:hypothetical protein
MDPVADIPSGNIYTVMKKCEFPLSAFLFAMKKILKGLCVLFSSFSDSIPDISVITTAFFTLNRLPIPSWLKV